VKSADRPEDDRDPAYPGITIITAESFSELVLNADKYVLLSVLSDRWWCKKSNALAPILYAVAEGLDQLASADLVLAKLDCENNDADPEYIPDTSLPTIRLFKKGEKNPEEVVQFEGDISIDGLLEFLHTELPEGTFNLSDAKIRAVECREQREKLAIKKVVQVHSGEEYENARNAAADEGKLILVYFYENWCQPPQMFADLSEEYPDMCFIKVNPHIQKQKPNPKTCSQSLAYYL